MPRGEVVGTSAAEGAERLQELWRSATRDGHISQREQYEIGLAVASNHREVQMVHAGLVFISRAVSGHGIFGEWFGRMARQHTQTWTDDAA